MSDEMTSASRSPAPWVIVLYVVALIAVVVGVDILFFRHHFLYRLIANVGIVLVFAAFGLRFLKRS